MIAKIHKDRSGMKTTLDYNENKVAMGVAERIAIFNSDALTRKQIEQEFQFYENHNIRSTNVSFQMSINPDPVKNESLSDQQASELAYEILDRLGYGNQPIIVYRHEDLDRTHFHVVTIRTNVQGKKIKDFKEQKDLQRILLQLSKKYEYTIGNSTDKQSTNQKKKNNKPNQNTGKKEDIINSCLEAYEKALSYKFTSFTQFKAILQWYGMTAFKIQINNKDAVCIQKLDSKGKGNQLPLNEKELRRNINDELQSRIDDNKQAPSRYIKERRRIENIFMNCLQKSTSLDNFTKKLSKSGIGLYVSRSKDKSIFGLTLIDHNEQLAFKGSQISKVMSASVFKQLEENDWDTSFIFGQKESQRKSEQYANKTTDHMADSGGDAYPDNSRENAFTAAEALEAVADLFNVSKANSDAQRKPSADARQGRKKKKNNT